MSRRDSAHIHKLGLGFVGAYPHDPRVYQTLGRHASPSHKINPKRWQYVADELPWSRLGESEKMKVCGEDVLTLSPHGGEGKGEGGFFNRDPPSPCK